MRLEDKFFNSFFYLFLVGIFFSLIILSLILFYYSENFLDKRTSSEVYYLEKKYAESNINSMNILILNLVLKLQVALQEQIDLYLGAARAIKYVSPEHLNFETKDVYNSYELRNLRDSKNFKSLFAGLWFLNTDITTIEQLDINTKRQIYSFALIIQNMYSMLNDNNDILKNFYLCFESTNLYIGFPYTYYKSLNFFDTFDKVSNPPWCTDTEGNMITYYKFQCRPFYQDLRNAQKKSMDLNWDNQKHRKIFLSTPYHQFGISSTESVFTLCIKFNDTLTNEIAYICGDSEDQTLFSSLDMLNDKLIGYISILSIGCNSAFYFPQISSGEYTKTLGEFIYRFDNNYYLEEKTNFMNKVQKRLTSNYINKINKTLIQNEPMSLFNELIINENQNFYINNEQNTYCLYPIIVQNMDNEYEHILSLVYIFNNNSYYSHINDFQSNYYGRLAFQIFLYIFFASVNLYIICLSFKLLAKIIVIPIKNVHYMLEGKNIGGEYRLEYLDELKKNQEENLEKQNKINQQSMQKNSKRNINLTELYNNDNEEIRLSKKPERDQSMNKSDQKKFFSSKKVNTSIKKETTNKEESKLISDSTIKEKTQKNIDIKFNKTNNKSTAGDEKLNTLENDLNNFTEDNNQNIITLNKNNINSDYDGEFIDSTINYEKKYDLDGVIIEKESNFYDFDEELLQYRPIELNNLIKSLLNLKSALILTSKSQNVENIINYTNSEFIFNDFKNKKGSRMCQSNIGNLQSRLLKYDKAIYHLALSLQNVDLKKFFSSNINDEFDESDFLLHKIEKNFKKIIKEKDTNKLVKKQQKEKKINFPQKIIEILINSRYNKLIHIYYKFFGFIKKNNFNYEKLSGNFMHSNFHTINCYHKILIQYIYLCFISNDLVKIGESILDYLEFLIKFKLKYSEEKAYIMNIKNKEIPEIKTKQLIKRKYFDKIINWINVFDNYTRQINENSALGNYKNILDAYSLNIHSNNQNQFDSKNESASVLLFQINLQRYDFLRGKFALVCKEYNDALGFMINAAKKKRIVIDGLIKKKALKHISKIANLIKKNIITNNYSKTEFYNIFEENKIKNININHNNPINNKESQLELKSMRLIDKIKDIIEIINNDINETDEKQLKDIIILIDCNLCDKLIIDSYIDVTKTIIKNYLANNDRICVFFLLNEYHIICPMKKKEDIDMVYFSKDLDTFSKKIFKKDKFVCSTMVREEINEKIKSEGIDSIEDSSDSNLSNSNSNELINKKNDKIENKIKAINYCLNYLKMKEIRINENFFIYFSENIDDLMNNLIESGNQDYLKNLSYESNKKKKIRLKKEKNISFLVIGKFREENEKEYKSVLIDYFGKKSEMIPFDNMKKIKTILSNNTIINDNIIFPNEVYK